MAKALVRTGADANRGLHVYPHGGPTGGGELSGGRESEFPDASTHPEVIPAMHLLLEAAPHGDNLGWGGAGAAQWEALALFVARVCAVDVRMPGRDGSDVVTSAISRGYPALALELIRKNTAMLEDLASSGALLAPIHAASRAGGPPDVLRALLQLHARPAASGAGSPRHFLASLGPASPPLPGDLLSHLRKGWSALPAGGLVAPAGAGRPGEGPVAAAARAGRWESVAELLRMTWAG
ncbi:hypothetical protein T484DRAFT_1765778 [Baffinella frigidus]|nr:hypothetical protein T484DRAFT_1765778 [Cryptophyta sp. CCMP2293]